MTNLEQFISTGIVKTEEATDSAYTTLPLASGGNVDVWDDGDVVVSKPGAMMVTVKSNATELRAFAAMALWAAERVEAQTETDCD